VPEIVDKESYRMRMTKQATFGGQTELQALSAILNCGIVVHPDNNEEQWELGIYFCSKAGAKNVAKRFNVGRRIILHVALDEDVRHYEAIVPGP
jgi:phage pi2 protein 07